MNILTVDDTKTARLIVRKCFEPLGHMVFDAENGQVALDVLASQSSMDLILLDWNMPVMDGLTCLTEIRKNPEYNGVKVIMCTTEAEKTKVMKALGKGANGFLIKPVKPETMLETVTKVVGNSAAAQREESEFEIRKRQEREAIRQASKPTRPDEAFVTKFVRPFVGTLQNFFQSVLETPLTVGAAKLKTDAISGFATSGTMTIVGKVSGRVVVSLSEQAAIGLTQKYLGMDKLPDDEIIADATGELTNIIVGKAATLVFGQQTNVPIPVVVHGSAYTIASQKGATCVAVGCKSELGDLELDVSITEG